MLFLWVVKDKLFYSAVTHFSWTTKQHVNNTVCWGRSRVAGGLYGMLYYSTTTRLSSSSLLWLMIFALWLPCIPSSSERSTSKIPVHLVTTTSSLRESFKDCDSPRKKWRRETHLWDEFRAFRHRVWDALIIFHLIKFRMMRQFWLIPIRLHHPFLINHNQSRLSGWTFLIYLLWSWCDFEIGF